MKETISDNYCPNDKPPSYSSSCTSSYVRKVHSLWSEFCHTIYFSMVSVLLLCPKLSYFIRECCALCFGEKLWRFMITSSPLEALPFAQPRGNKLSFFEKVTVSSGNNW